MSAPYFSGVFVCARSRDLHLMIIIQRSAFSQDVDSPLLTWFACHSVQKTRSAVDPSAYGDYRPDPDPPCAAFPVGAAMAVFAALVRLFTGILVQMDCQLEIYKGGNIFESFVGKWSFDRARMYTGRVWFVQMV
jgi:hypothetical protein